MITMASRLKQKQSDFDLAIKNATTHKTDLNRWRLKDDRGIQTWHYLHSDKELKEWPITTADKFHMGLDTVRLILVTVISILT
jgi:lanosterol synthase